MSSNNSIELALTRAKKHLLIRFMSILLLSLLIVELIIGAIFFFDLYQTEKKILQSISIEYQRILTYDSGERLLHVLEANPHRLFDNNIAAYHVSNTPTPEITFISGVHHNSKNITFEHYEIDENRSWIDAFIVNPYMSVNIKGDSHDFWLVLDNRSRDAIAYNQWLMTLYAMLALTIVTTIFTHRVIQNTMSPLITFEELLDKLKKGQLELTDIDIERQQGLNIISSHVYNAVAKLQHMTTTLNTTVDAIAHDIRTPLSRITLASQTTLLNTPDKQSLKSALADCSEYAMQASNMLTALMKLNDELTGKRESKKVPTHVSDVIAKVVSWYEDIAEDKHIKLVIENTDNLIILSDPDKLTQILVNIIDNAIKYTHPEGTVTIKAQQNAKNSIEISIQDTGVGIDSKYQDLIFERLYRVDNSRSNVEGDGLGLSFALAMIENLEGKLIVKSKLGIGSTFIISL
ncbi:HAMP domain-containing histidine kinase [Vibrio sp.]|nr:HAMP domain-containing histidine kinase [Vibrio sp.]